MTTLAQQKHSITIPGRKRDRVQLLRQYRGIEAEVARECGVSRSHVCKVVHRNSKSDRVWQSLLAAIARREPDRRQAA